MTNTSTQITDGRRQKGKRGGLRIIYYWWLPGAQFWLFTVYGKDVQDDLDPTQKKVLGQMLETERRQRTGKSSATSSLSW